MYEIFSKIDSDNISLLDEKIKDLGEEEFVSSARLVILQTIDLFWVSHLEMMDYMRASVNLRAYGQRDPLVEYKREGLQLFKDMQVSIETEIVKLVPLLIAREQTKQPADLKEIKKGADLLTSQGNSIVYSGSGEKKVGRNDTCPCGSGKKYKKCHGK